MNANIVFAIMTFLFFINTAKSSDQMIVRTVDSNSVFTIYPAAVISVDLGVRIATFNLVAHPVTLAAIIRFLIWTTPSKRCFTASTGNVITAEATRPWAMFQLTNFNIFGCWNAKTMILIFWWLVNIFTNEFQMHIVLESPVRLCLDGKNIHHSQWICMFHQCSDLGSTPDVLQNDL